MGRGDVPISSKTFTVRRSRRRIGFTYWVVTGQSLNLKFCLVAVAGSSWYFAIALLR